MVMHTVKLLVERITNLIADCPANEVDVISAALLELFEKELYGLGGNNDGK